jgi:hypothetical protein
VASFQKPCTNANDPGCTSILDLGRGSVTHDGLVGALAAAGLLGKPGLKGAKLPCHTSCVSLAGAPAVGDVGALATKGQTAAVHLQVTMGPQASSGSMSFQSGGFRGGTADGRHAGAAGAAAAAGKTLAKASFSGRAHQRLLVTLKLGAAGRRLLGQHKQLVVGLLVTARTGGKILTLTKNIILIRISQAGSAAVARALKRSASALKHELQGQKLAHLQRLSTIKSSFRAPGTGILDEAITYPSRSRTNNLGSLEHLYVAPGNASVPVPVTAASRLLLAHARPRKLIVKLIFQAMTTGGRIKVLSRSITIPIGP